MINLLVSKINEIKVIQVGKSSLNIKHKKCDSEKPSKSGANPLDDDDGGENETVDLGAGKKTHKITVYTFDRNETDDLYEILYNQRYCTITDKFFGKISIYVDDISITNSDEHINRTLIEISGIVQDIKKVPIPDVKAILETKKEELIQEQEVKALEIAEQVETTDTLRDSISNIEKFIDETLDTTSEALNKILDLQGMPLSTAYNKIRSKVDKIQSIMQTLKLIKDIPSNFINLVKSFIDIETEETMSLFRSITSKNEVVGRNFDYTKYSQFEVESILKSLKTNELLNLTVSIAEINQVIKTEWTTQREFVNQVNTLIERLEYSGLEYDFVVEIQHVVKEYSLSKPIRKLIDYEIKREKPLISIIYSLYGNLDNYDNIRDINALSDNDNISGVIKVYEYESIN
jgi:hypothetical protein